MKLIKLICISTLSAILLAIGYSILFNAFISKRINYINFQDNIDGIYQNCIGDTDNFEHYNNTLTHESMSSELYNEEQNVNYSMYNKGDTSVNILFNFVNYADDDNNNFTQSEIDSAFQSFISVKDYFSVISQNYITIEMDYITCIAPKSYDYYASLTSANLSIEQSIFSNSANHHTDLNGLEKTLAFSTYQFRVNIFAGNSTSWNTFLWPHAYSSKGLILLTESKMSLGTLTHEMCHTFGVGDLYAFTGSQTFGVGRLDLMGSSEYGNNLNAHYKETIGWINSSQFNDDVNTPIEELSLSQLNGQDLTLYPSFSTDNSKTIAYKFGENSSGTEYFMVEYRIKNYCNNFDKYLYNSASVVVYRVHKGIRGNSAGNDGGDIELIFMGNTNYSIHNPSYLSSCELVENATYGGLESSSRCFVYSSGAGKNNLFNGDLFPATLTIKSLTSTCAIISITYGVTPTCLITWCVDDEVIYSENVEIGTMPIFDVNNYLLPTKQDNAQYTYTFDGWEPAISIAISDITYNAKFSSALKSYTITYHSVDDTIYSTQIKEYGSFYTMQEIPQKTNGIFIGWTTIPGSTIAEWQSGQQVCQGDKIWYAVWGISHSLTYFYIDENATVQTIYDNEQSELNFGYNSFIPSIKSFTIDRVLNNSFICSGLVYTFIGFTENEHDTDARFANNDDVQYKNTSIDVTNTVHLFAVYITTANVVFDSNESIAQKEEIFVNVYKTANNNLIYTTPTEIELPLNNFNMQDHVLYRWALNSINGTQYQIGSLLEITENTTFYAIWQAKTVIKLGILQNIAKIEYSLSSNGYYEELTPSGFIANTNQNYYFRAILNEDVGYNIIFSNFSGWFDDTTNPSSSHSFTENNQVYYVGATATKIDILNPLVTIERLTHDSFRWTITDNDLICGYIISTEPSNPTITSNWINVNDKSINGTYTINSNTESVYYIWALDKTGNISESANIKSHRLTKNQGINTMLTIKDSDSNGIDLQTECILDETIIYVSAAPYEGYSVTLSKNGVLFPNDTTFIISANTILESNASIMFYNVTWKNCDKIIYEDRLPYNSMPSYNMDIYDFPFKESTAEYDYIFSGWSPEITNVKSDITYNALFNVIEKVFTVAIEFDAKLLDIKSNNNLNELHYGENVTINIKYDNKKYDLFVFVNNNKLHLDNGCYSFIVTDNVLINFQVSEKNNTIVNLIIIFTSLALLGFLIYCFISYKIKL